MCGIIGYTGRTNAVPIVMDGLSRLQYRGYDSAGIAVCGEEGRIHIRRRMGKLNDLSLLLEAEDLKGSTAIGHTRWATHGRPSEENAHPHSSGSIALVHNGIIENHLTLKKSLQGEGYVFSSDTDTEVICHLIDKHSGGKPLEDAVLEAIRHLKGAFAIAVISDKEPGKIVAARKDSPLVLGIGKDGLFVASDVPAFLNYTKEVVFLEEGEIAVLSDGGFSVVDFEGSKAEKKPETIPWSSTMAEKGGYRHFMLKEIFEQPRALADTMLGRFSVETGRVNLDEFGIEEDFLKGLNRIFIVACGTSWHAALCGKHFIEKLSRVPVETDISSEFRYRSPLAGPGDLFIAITQSGETADTLAAQREAKRLGARTLCISNVIGSTSAREADSVFYTRSGPEIGVASTKAFTTQLVALYLFAVALGSSRGNLPEERSRELLSELLKLPEKVEEALSGDEAVERTAREFFKAKDFLYLGRGLNFPIALEGALKLKEISYIHAEAYPAGEMKHGPIALIDEDLPVLVIAPQNGMLHKVISNIEEVKSRGGRVISLSDGFDAELNGVSGHSLKVPSIDEMLLPVVMTVPLQLLAYHIGVLRGCDVDQPRNLAKSVTVE